MCLPPIFSYIVLYNYHTYIILTVYLINNEQIFFRRMFSYIFIENVWLNYSS